MNRLSITLLFVFLFGVLSISAQTVTGKWKTIDDETGEARSIVEIIESNGKIYGKIIDILNPSKKNLKCQNCSGEDKDKALIGLTIIKGLSKDGKEYNNGKILDPSSGKTYKCKITLDGIDKLNVRGYLGVSVFGRTQTWIRMK